jgi:hypothetical protein
MGAEVAVAEPLPLRASEASEANLRLVDRAIHLREQLSVLRRHRVAGDEGKLLAGLLSPQSTTELNLLNTQVPPLALRARTARPRRGSSGLPCSWVGKRSGWTRGHRRHTRTRGICVRTRVAIDTGGGQPSPGCRWVVARLRWWRGGDGPMVIFIARVVRFPPPSSPALPRCEAHCAAPLSPRPVRHPGSHVRAYTVSTVEPEPRRTPYRAPRRVSRFGGSGGVMSLAARVRLWWWLWAWPDARTRAVHSSWGIA